MSDAILYAAFAVVVASLLAVDLFVVHRHTHAVSLREAATWSGIWIGVSVVFGMLVPTLHAGAGSDARIEFFTGYVIEKSLSVDNVFLFVLIFAALSVPRELHHRVLFYGVLGAIVMRTALVFTGAALIERFEWILYLFGAFLVYAGYRTWTQRDEHPDISESRLLERIRRIVPTTSEYHGQRFVVREDGRLRATPMLVVLILVEFTDLVFAMDSIPAVFAVTRDPFIVLTSNILAILGLRALYFLLAAIADRLRYLKAGLAIILAFVGLKLLTEAIPGAWHPDPLQSLAVIGGVLAVVTVASLRAPAEAGAVPFGIAGIFSRRRRRRQNAPD